MTGWTFSSLPNEIYLLILGYLSSFERYKAFFAIGNKRLQGILHCQSLTLNATLISYTEMNEMFLSSDYFRLLDTIILDQFCSSVALIDYWEKKLSSVTLTPNLQRLLVEGAERYGYSLPHPLLSFLATTTPLQSIDLTFESTNSSYEVFIERLIKRNISFHTMIFKMKEGQSSAQFGRSSLVSFSSSL